jgi:hypothetical protein
LLFLHPYFFLFIFYLLYWFTLYFPILWRLLHLVVI